MSHRPFRPGAACRALVLALLAFAVAVVPTAAASGKPKPRHRYSVDGWVRVHPHQTKRAQAKKKHLKRQAAHQASQTVAASPYGIAAGGNLQNLGTDEQARELDVYRSAGARWIRVDINWEVIQSGGPSSYNWAPFDRVVRAASDRGLQVLAAFIYTPAWARPGTNDGRYPPSDLGAFAAFCRAAVAHYAPLGVHTWEVWNEPNISGFWRPGPDPARYAQMLGVAYDAIKRSDPHAFVVSAGLSPYGGLGAASPTAMNPVTFLQKMYAAGAGGHFDALGWHPYEWGVGVKFHPMSAWSQLVETPTSARSVMVANGDGGKQIWGTEYGAPTFGGGIPEDAQAHLVTAAYERWNKWSWTGPLFWYSARDAGTKANDREDHFGLVRRDFSPKASFAAYKALASAG
jgi:polysaccharide biosynthesis protein PslG